jgi:hypothetical protein
MKKPAGKRMQPPPDMEPENMEAEREPHDILAKIEICNNLEEVP